MAISNRVPIGLFDFTNYWDIVDVLNEVLQLSKEEIQERLFKEAIQTGWNVSKDAQEFDVTPHIYNDRMEEFYQNTDAFVFELLIGHLNQYCQEIDHRVSETVTEHFPLTDDIKILSLGDGIGTDTLRFAEVGYDVTYFDFEGYSSQLAKYRFERQSVYDQITILHQLDKIIFENFDIVISREVLEHVKYPQNVINRIWAYLRNGGLAIITESFGRVEPAFPTHLKSNQKFDGQTERLFVETGFRLLKTFPGRRPMVFQKVAKLDKSRFDTLAPPRQEQEYDIQKKIKKIGKRLLRMIRF